MSNQWSDADRIRRLAQGSYPPGVELQATFRTRGHQELKNYMNPADIPVSIYSRKHRETLLLYSVSRTSGHNIRAEQK